jgi:YD repeat-containing protein
MHSTAAPRPRPSPAVRRNGLVATLKDAENNLTTYQYDGFDRLSKTLYPTALPQGAGTSNASDYEQLTYDANGNVLTRKVRSGVTIGFTYPLPDNCRRSLRLK